MNINEACENALWRNVKTVTGSTSGSGVVICTGVVMTCFHCLHVDCEIIVDDEQATILGVDPKHDLCLLSVRTLDAPPIVIAFASLGEEVLSAGNPLTFNDALMFGRIVHIDEERIAHDMHGAPGISGSGLFNTSGCLVGVNHSVTGRKNIGSWLTLAVPSQSLQKILQIALRIVQPTPQDVEKYGVQE